VRRVLAPYAISAALVVVIAIAVLAAALATIDRSSGRRTAGSALGSPVSTTMP